MGNFYSNGDSYSRFRPTYPQELFAFINKNVLHKDLAWDCATGNGQAALPLSKEFKKVYATDISANQIQNATTASNIVYAIESATSCSLPDHSADLVTIAQALHWLQPQLFYKEVNRVLKPGGIIAAWTYGLISIDERTDEIIHRFHFDFLRDYWDKERAHVVNNYRDVPFPFNAIPAPEFSIKLIWRLSDLEGYLGTWSAVASYRKGRGDDPVSDVIGQIARFWPMDNLRPVSFPLHLKLGSVV
jgi:SAM-dependent methyltransferase